jgi:glycosyltransferase involved in cell wall biosynthesis
MKIAVDAGGLCAKNDQRFGNYVFTKNLIEAISRYDHKNKYILYSFCDKPKWLKTNYQIEYQETRPLIGWLKLWISLREWQAGSDVFLGLNQSFPKTKAKKIAFSHGLSFFYYPDLYPDSYKKLSQQLDLILKGSGFIVVSSKKVRNELVRINKNIASKIKVLLPGIPFDMETQLRKKLKKENYFLFVGMNHPIKNVDFIIRTVANFNQRYKKNHELYLAGNFDINSPMVKSFPNLSREKLKKLYQQATALLTASFYESFNFPVLEGLSCGCPVVGLKSAIIPEMKQFVHLANDEEDFFSHMKNITMGKIKKIDQKKISEIFSWKKYIEQLTDLYKNYD